VATTLARGSERKDKKRSTEENLRDLRKGNYAPHLKLGEVSRGKGGKVGVRKQRTKNMGRKGERIITDH